MHKADVQSQGDTGNVEVRFRSVVCGVTRSTVPWFGSLSRLRARKTICFVCRNISATADKGGRERSPSIGQGRAAAQAHPSCWIAYINSLYTYVCLFVVVAVGSTPRENENSSLRLRSNRYSWTATRRTGASTASSSGTWRKIYGCDAPPHFSYEMVLAVAKIYLGVLACCRQGPRSNSPEVYTVSIGVLAHPLD